MNMLVTDTACLCLIPVCMLFQWRAPKGADTQTHYRLHKVVQRTYSESVTDTAFLYGFPVCILVQETWDVPYAHIKWSVRSPQRGKTL